MEPIGFSVYKLNIMLMSVFIDVHVTMQLDYQLRNKVQGNVLTQKLAIFKIVVL